MLRALRRLYAGPDGLLEAFDARIIQLTDDDSMVVLRAWGRWGRRRAVFMSTSVMLMDARQRGRGDQAYWVVRLRVDGEVTAYVRGPRGVSVHLLVQHIVMRCEGAFSGQQGAALGAFEHPVPPGMEWN